MEFYRDFNYNEDFLSLPLTFRWNGHWAKYRGKYFYENCPKEDDLGKHKYANQDLDRYIDENRTGPAVKEYIKKIKLIKTNDNLLMLVHIFSIIDSATSSQIFSIDIARP